MKSEFVRDATVKSNGYAVVIYRSSTSLAHNKLSCTIHSQHVLLT